MNRLVMPLQLLRDPLVLLSVMAAGLVIAAGLVWWMRRPSGTRGAARGAARAAQPNGGEFIRRRVQMLAADGATPDRIARDTGLSRDVVMMALRASPEPRTAKSAGTAQRPSGRRLHSSTPRSA
jgi:hypothetical protein